LHLLVVADDREYLPQQTLKTLGFAAFSEFRRKTITVFPGCGAPSALDIPWGIKLCDQIILKPFPITTWGKEEFNQRPCLVCPTDTSVDHAVCLLPPLEHVARLDRSVSRVDAILKILALTDVSDVPVRQEYVHSLVSLVSTGYLELAERPFTEAVPAQVLLVVVTLPRILHGFWGEIGDTHELRLTSPNRDTTAGLYVPLKEPVVAGQLNVDEVRHRGGVADLREVPHLIHSQHRSFLFA
jgi:hypothetical protein